MQTKKWGHFDIVTNSDNRVAIQNVIKNANAQRTTQHFPLIMPAIVLAIALATGCSNPDATTDDQTGGGTPPGGGTASCTCSCSGSVLLQQCGGQLSRLGDYGTPAKCQAQVSTHPGCR